MLTSLQSAFPIESFQSWNGSSRHRHLRVGPSEESQTSSVENVMLKIWDSLLMASLPIIKK